MSQKTNIYSDDWCEMIFAEKNHEYGAFMLRKQSVKRQLWATLMAITFFTVAVSSPVILKNIIPEPKKPNLGLVELGKYVIDKPKTDVKEIVVEKVEQFQSSIKLTPPVITPDELVNESEEIKSQDEILNSRKAISTIDHDGTENPNDPFITDLDKPNATGDPVVEVTRTVVDQMPEFKGGDDELTKYLRDNIKYPQIAREAGTQGIVYVTFVVTKTGRIQAIKILRGVGDGCDEEAIRVLKTMPDWKPGRENGQAVQVQINLPINFKLNN